MNSLDETDLKIISLLQEDGRMSFVKMAKILGITDATARRKVGRLIDEKIVKISAVCSPYDLGFDSPVVMGINTNQKDSTKIAKRLSIIPEVQFVTIATGTYEIITIVAAKSNKNLYDLAMEIGAMDGVIRTQSMLMLKIFKQSWNLANIS
jgi:Lrp/AsnC family transcriptional regulator, regulator for asnA, asnC and gidA